MRSILPVALASVLALLLPAGAAGDESTRAFLLAASCAACHGTDGASPGAIPTLAGKSRRFIEVALEDFKSGASTGTVMNRLARGYTDEEIRLIAGYFAARQ